MLTPSNKETSQELLHNLEAVMVNQFRISQNLLVIVEQERQALVQNDVAILSKLIEEKEMLLDEMGQCENSRKGISEKLALLNGFSETTRLGELLGRFQTISIDRIKRLHEGIMVVQGKIKEINYGNQALANFNLERLNSLQGFLLSLFTPSSFYQPSGTLSAERPTANYGMDQKV